MKINRAAAYWVLLGIILASSMLSAQPALADHRLGLDKAREVADANDLYLGDASSAILNVVRWLLSFTAILALAALIWAGFLYITSFTDEEKTKKAKKTAFYAIIGLLVMVAAFVILEVIKNNFTS